MEQSIITFGNGMTRNPSDMAAADGDLAECVNYVAEGGELKPIMEPSKMNFKMGTGETILHIQNVRDKKIYITYLNTYIYAFTVDNEGARTYIKAKDSSLDYITSINGVTDISSVGNTMIVVSESGINYILYNGDNYVVLGKNPPMINLSFGLQGYYSSTDGDLAFNLGGTNNINEYELGAEDGIGGSYTLTSSRKDEWQPIFNSVKSSVNKLINEEGNKKGRFVFPFFVRYAYKLYDGTYMMHSAPVLMIPSLKISPIAYIRDAISGSTGGSHYGLDMRTRVAGMFCSLCYKVDSIYNEDTGSYLNISELNKWGDIIKSVEVAVSAPIFTYDQEGDIDGWTYYSESEKTNYNNYSFSKIVNCKYSLGVTIDYTKTNFFNQYIHCSQEWSGGAGIGEQKYKGYNCPSLLWNLPTRDNDKIIKDIETCSNFYKVKSYKITELTNSTFKEVEIPEGTLGDSLYTTTALSDDYCSHTNIKPKQMYVYNKRLNVSNIKQQLFNGFMSSQLTQYMSGQSAYTIYTYIKKNERDIVVVNKVSNSTDPVYLYYPDANAYKMVISCSKGIATVDLSSHDFLNGAYWFDGFNCPSFVSGSVPTASTDRWVIDENKMFTSEVNNPFVWPVGGINTIGTGKIIGICSTTKALSEGQFGQFPLIAFCSDGIWAMEVSNDGSYSAKQPISRDVCISADSICQLDGAIVFASQGRLNVIEGANVTCISGKLSGGTFDIERLRDVKSLQNMYQNIYANITDMDSFFSYLDNAFIAYDYSDSCIYICNPSKAYQYMYSFESGTFCKVTRDRLSGDGVNRKYITYVNDYPDTILQDSDGNLYSLYDKQDVNTVEIPIYGVAVTRPLVLDAPNARKTLMQLRNIGTFNKESFVKMKIYGSNDCKNWFLKNSRYGTSFTYYRFAYYLSMLPTETLAGTKALFDTRLTDKLR